MTGATALYLAAQNGHGPVVSHLLRVGASVNEASNTNETPLFIASQRGHAEIVRLLLKAAGNVNQGCILGMTPLQMACLGHHMDVFHLLLAAKAQPCLQNGKGNTALALSMAKGHWDMAAELLD